MNRTNRRIVRNAIRILLKVVACICIVLIGMGLYQSYSNRMIQERLQVLRDAAKEEKGTKLPEEEGADRKDGFQEETESCPQILPEYAALYELNHDLIGWLSIEGTLINYPVMKGKDDEYYLQHDFEGNESRYGCLFVKKFVNVDDVHLTNVIIYGHNMKDGSMFGQLNKYKDKDFFAEHPYIVFHTLYEKRMYEIVASFPSQVYDVAYEGFKYYEFYQADTEEEFLYFYDNIKGLALYDTGVCAEYGDRFISLSTCDYNIEGGRFVVVGKELAKIDE